MNTKVVASNANFVQIKVSAVPMARRAPKLLSKIQGGLLLCGG